MVRIHFRWKNFFICFAISLGALAYGYLAAIISTTMGKPAFLMYMGLGDESGGVFHDKENLQGAITSVFQVFCPLFFTQCMLTARPALLLAVSVVAISPIPTDGKQEWSIAPCFRFLVQQD